MSALESLITSDLAALGEDSRRNLAGLDDSLSEKNMYRDDAPGAKARRDALADVRRRELAMMPLMLSHVFAHRVARAAAGCAAMLVSLLAVGLLAEPALLRYAFNFVPSLVSVANLDSAIMMTAIMLLVVYLIALWIAQSWFARRMRDAVRTSNEPYQDLDALARGPLEFAQQAVRRVDGYALAGALGGATMLALVCGYVTVIFDTVGTDPTAWRVGGSFLYMLTVVKNIGVLAIPLAIAGITAFVVGREGRRAGGSTFLGMLSHPTSLLFSGFLAFATVYLSVRTAARIRAHDYLPAISDRYMLAIAIVVAMLGVGSYVLLWWRNRENRTIGD